MKDSSKRKKMKHDMEAFSLSKSETISGNLRYERHYMKKRQRRLVRILSPLLTTGIIGVVAYECSSIISPLLLRNKHKFSEEVITNLNQKKQLQLDTLYKTDDIETNVILDLMAGYADKNEFNMILRKYGYDTIVPINKVSHQDPALYKTLWNLHKKYGNPSITIGAAFENPLSGEADPEKAMFDPRNNQIRIHNLNEKKKSFGDPQEKYYKDIFTSDAITLPKSAKTQDRQRYLLNNRIAELAHAIQCQRDGGIAFSVNFGIDELKESHIQRSDSIPHNSNRKAIIEYIINSLHCGTDTKNQLETKLQTFSTKRLTKDILYATIYETITKDKCVSPDDAKQQIDKLKIDTIKKWNSYSSGPTLEFNHPITYNKAGAVEHEAHAIIEPRLVQEFIEKYKSYSDTTNPDVQYRLGIFYNGYFDKYSNPQKAEERLIKSTESTNKKTRMNNRYSCFLLGNRYWQLFKDSLQGEEKIIDSISRNNLEQKNSKFLEISLGYYIKSAKAGSLKAYLNIINIYTYYTCRLPNPNTSATQEKYLKETLKRSLDLVDNWENIAKNDKDIASEEIRANLLMKVAELYNKFGNQELTAYYAGKAVATGHYNFIAE